MRPDSPHYPSPPVVGTLDGTGAGDHDQPYQFGSRPNANVTYPFSTRENSRLLVLRGRVQDGLICCDAA
jgi:hypothetical protein